MSRDEQTVSDTTTARKRVIFRPEALQQYMQGREKAVLPRYTVPAVAFMWTLLGLLLITGLIVGLGLVPAYSQAACAGSRLRALVEIGPERVASELPFLRQPDRRGGA